MNASKQDAGKQFADIWAEAIQSNRNLRIITVALGMSLLLVLIITLRLAWQPPPKPIVVRVDEVGRAEALAYEAATAKADPLDPTTKYFLNRFVHDFYSRRTATVHDHWTRSLRFLTTNLADKAFADSSEQIALVSGGFADNESQVENVVLRIHAAEEPPAWSHGGFRPGHPRPRAGSRTAALVPVDPVRFPSRGFPGTLWSGTPWES